MESDKNHIIVPEETGRDITGEFVRSVTDLNFDYHSFLHSLKTEKLLVINLDLVNYDRGDFISFARKAKAFLEGTKPKGQERNASIRCTKEQKAWEYNVFASGVDWVEATK